MRLTTLLSRSTLDAEAMRARLERAGAPHSLVELAAQHAEWLVATIDARRRNWIGDWAAWTVSESAIRAELGRADADRRRAAVAYALVVARSAGGPHYSLPSTPEGVVLARLARRKLPWTGEELSWLLRSAAGRSGGRDRRRHELEELAALPLAAAERLDDTALASLIEPLQALATALGTARSRGMGTGKAVRQATVLLERARPGSVSTLPDDLLSGDDTFGPAARRALLERYEPAALLPTLRHLSGYGGGVTPTRAWRTATADLLEADQPAESIVELLLAQTLRHREQETVVVWAGYRSTELVFAAPDTATVLRAAVWARAAEQATSDSVALIGDVAVHCGTGLGGSGGRARCAPVCSSAIAALAEKAADPERAPDVVAQLSRIRDRVPNKTIRKLVDKALDSAAAAAGLTPSQLLERSVPSFGLGPDGTAEHLVGDHTALVRLTNGAAGAKLETRWRTPAGRVVATTPAVVRTEHAHALAALRATAAQTKKVAASQRQRLEDLLAADRTWAVSTWVDHYAGHPVVGMYARMLIWQVRSAACEGTWSSGLPEAGPAGWVLVDHDGRSHPLAADDDVRLWHPIREPLADVRAWRAHLSERAIRQPFKQAFREIYLLTPAEEATRTYSNRFAAHILRYPQAGALMRTRGWSGAHLGYWDGGYEATATRPVGEDGWRASFDYSLVERDEDGYGQVSLASSDQVRFERWTGQRLGREWQPQPLSEVPPLVLSEALRDVDLFIGVTSIAADPAWADRGTDRHRDYWHRTSFGDLTESAQMRREVLTSLLPRTKLAGRAELGGNFLVVHGHLRDYRIHLGSTNILMSPSDTYLCIVPAQHAKDPKVFLPFEEGGGKLSVILSKAFLLAEDTSITDPSITRQLRAGL